MKTYVHFNYLSLHSGRPSGGLTYKDIELCVPFRKIVLQHINFLHFMGSPTNQLLQVQN